MTKNHTECMVCKGAGTGEHARSRGNGYKLSHSTRPCSNCAGTGAVEVKRPEDVLREMRETQEVGEIPDWMLGEEEDVAEIGD